MQITHLLGGQDGGRQWLGRTGCNRIAALSCATRRNGCALYLPVVAEDRRQAQCGRRAKRLVGMPTAEASGALSGRLEMRMRAPCAAHACTEQARRAACQLVRWLPARQGCRSTSRAPAPRTAAFRTLRAAPLKICMTCIAVVDCMHSALCVRPHCGPPAVAKAVRRCGRIVGTVVGRLAMGLEGVTILPSMNTPVAASLMILAEFTVLPPHAAEVGKTGKPAMRRRCIPFSAHPMRLGESVVAHRDHFELRTAERRRRPVPA